MIKTIQRPLACRNAHCGAMCSPADAEFFRSNPSKCYNYERRDDLYMTKSIPSDKVKCTRGGTLFDTEKIINSLPTANVISIPEGATNGEMLKSMFPNVEIEGICGLEGLQCVAVSIGLGTSYFALDWWNAPYKREVEDE